MLEQALVEGADPAALDGSWTAPFDVPGGLVQGRLIDLAVERDILQKSGSWFNMGELRLGQGRDAAKQYFRDHPDEAAKLEAAVRENFHKLMGSQSRVAAKAAGRAVDVSADDFDDED